MDLNIIKLKEIQYDFSSYSSRLLQADFHDYLDVLTKYINFLKSTPLINEYIINCGEPSINIEAEIQDVNRKKSDVFDVGNTDKEEVSNVFAILEYIVNNKINVTHGLIFGYSSSNMFQDKIKGFNDRFVMILIRHIERYLTKVGIGMGIDENVTYNVTVNNGQAIIAINNSNVNATNTINNDIDEINQLIEKIKKENDCLNDEDKKRVEESLDVIQNEVSSQKPRKSMLEMAIKILNTIKSASECSVAIAELIKLIQTIML